MSDEKSKARQDKVDAIIKSLTASPEGLQVLMSSLKKSGLSAMKILSKDIFPTVDDPVRLAMAKKGIILDTETTGVDTENDEIIELAMVEFFFDDQGIIAIGEVYDEFNEPQKKRIDEEVEALTGITNEMVAGKKIDPAEVKAIVADSDIALAHHAAFDRKIVEKNLPGCGLEAIDWHCSVNQVEWIKRGKSGRSLEVLALSEGLVYGSHRADADCLATAFVLNSEDEDGKPAFVEMLEQGRQDSLLIIAEDSPFSTKDALKDRGYRWCADGLDTFGYKAWYREIPASEAAMSEEADFLRGTIYRKDVALPMYRISAADRYSARKPGAKEFFRTSEIQTIEEASDQRNLEVLPGMSM